MEEKEKSSRAAMFLNQIAMAHVAIGTEMEQWYKHGSVLERQLESASNGTTGYTKTETGYSGGGLKWILL